MNNLKHTMIILFFILALISIGSCASQSDSDSGSRITVYKTLNFIENFNNNTREWHETDDEDCLLKIQDGYYIFEYKKYQGSWFIYKDIEIDQARNFIIESSIKKESGDEAGAYGLVWGANGSDNFYVLMITSNGQFLYAQGIDGKLIPIHEWTDSSFINTGYEQNTLSITKTYNTLTLFINGKPVYEDFFEPFFGNYIGFVVLLKQKLLIDSLIIKQ